MLMRLFRFVLPVLCILSLSACTGTVDGLQKDYKELTRWSKGKPGTDVERSIGPMPRGYYGQNSRRVLLKPPGVQGVDAASLDAPQPDVTWTDVGDYNSYRTLKPADATPAEVPHTQYNNQVKVYSLEGGAPGYDGVTVVSGNGTEVSSYGGAQGMPAEQVFFGHGSSHVKAQDKKKLESLAAAMRYKQGVAVTVVGHASQRVDGVTDPMKRKMINFDMAQKRADAVTKILRKAGLAPGWVHATSKGDGEPNPAPPPGMSQEAADRRADVYVEE